MSRSTGTPIFNAPTVGPSIKPDLLTHIGADGLTGTTEIRSNLSVAENALGAPTDSGSDLRRLFVVISAQFGRAEKVELVRAVSTVERAQMGSGRAADVGRGFPTEHDDPLAGYLTMINEASARPLARAAELGARAGRVDAQVAATLSSVAEHFGMAHRMRDDLLAMHLDAGTALPVVCTLRRPGAASTRLAHLLSLEHRTDEQLDEMHGLVRAAGLPPAKAQLRRFTRLAWMGVEQLPASPMINILDLLIGDVADAALESTSL